MGRRKSLPVAPAEPRSANTDPMFVQFLEMSNLLNTDSKGVGMAYSIQRALSRSTIIAPIKQPLINWAADFAQPRRSRYSIGWRRARTDRGVMYGPSGWRTTTTVRGSQ